jgi:hypothetical protein
MRLPGRFLVKGSDATDSPNGKSETQIAPLLVSDVSLSFWGGIDPVTSIVIDALHPLAGQAVADTILCLPSGRGSCTASQVLLELILNDKAPKALVMRDVDGLACVGALVAQEILRCPTLDILHVGDDTYRALLKTDALYGSVLANGELVVGSDEQDVRLQVPTSLRAPNDTSIESVGEESSTEPDARTSQEERLLHHCRSEAERMALRVIFRYARLSSATPSYLPVVKAHIDGTYVLLETCMNTTRLECYAMLPIPIHAGLT